MGAEGNAHRVRPWWMQSQFLPDIDACHLTSNHDDCSSQLILRLSHPHITALELIYHGL